MATAYINRRLTPPEWEEIKAAIHFLPLRLQTDYLKVAITTRYIMVLSAAEPEYRVTFFREPYLHKLPRKGIELKTESEYRWKRHKFVAFVTPCKRTKRRWATRHGYHHPPTESNISKEIENIISQPDPLAMAALVS